MANARWGRRLAAGVVGLVLAVAAVALPASAQGYFGQNQVQYDRFRWQVIETEHFLVHYYPEERVAAMDAARMAERGYARLTRVLDHQFREKKPIILFASRTDFGQNNVTGDLGEGTAGVTDLARQRNILPFTGDYRSFEHVLMHEMVHQFQYDVFARGKAGANVQQFAQVNPPLWFMEGMAEYLSIGPDYPNTNAIMRDAALNGRIPTIEQMAQRPDLFFPYAFGESLWAYVGQRWGDEVIGRILDASVTQGIERAFKRELGMDLEELSDEWREAVQTQFLPQVATLERARRVAQPMLSQKRTGGGGLFIAPTLSEDGRYVAFISTGSFLRGEVFPDIYLADARTGKRIKRLTRAYTNAEQEELRLLYSQSSFSPDGRFLAYNAQRRGKDVIYLLDVRRRKTIARLDLGLESATNPAWSPDGKRLVFSGGRGGLTDLYVVDADGKNLRQLTNDRHGDLQPQWSPDGRTIAFASDRGPETNFETLRVQKWQVSLYDLASGRIDILPAQAGLNLNPMWAPDGRSLAFISDRTGTPNIFLYDLDARQHFQLTNLIGSVGGFTEFSPAITWARKADRLAFAYYEGGDYTVWSVDNPRLLRRDPYVERQTVTPMVQVIASLTARDTSLLRPRLPGGGLASAARPADTTLAGRVAAGSAGTARPTAPSPFMVDDSAGRRSFYRSAEGAVRMSDALPAGMGPAAATVTVAQLLDSAELALPDTARFKTYAYRMGFQPDYVARPQVGFAQDNFGRGVFGGTTIVLSDLLGDHRLAVSGAVNGRFSEAQVFAGYTNLGRRLNWTTMAMQTPFYFPTSQGLLPPEPGLPEGTEIEQYVLTRFIFRQVGGAAIYPFTRFSRAEFGATFNNIDRREFVLERLIFNRQVALTDFTLASSQNAPSFNYLAPYMAYVSDNTLFGYTAPIYGRRMRFEVAPTIGTLKWVDITADYRRYDPILFNFLTVATRLLTNQTIGPDEANNPKFIGLPQFVRGYDRNNFSQGCNGPLQGGQATFGCGATDLQGSRVAVANAELRFPVIRRLDLGILPISLPPLEGHLFYDAGLAWGRGQKAVLRRPGANAEPNTRHVYDSYGAGLRFNAFGIAILRMDYAIPLASATRKGFWVWSVGPGY